MTEEYPYSDAYLRMHARPGEEWEDVRQRLLHEGIPSPTPRASCKACVETQRKADQTAKEAREELSVLMENLMSKTQPFDRLWDAMEALSYMKVCLQMGLIDLADVLPLQRTATEELVRAQDALLQQFPGPNSER